jgi:hypothetical protein
MTRRGCEQLAYAQLLHEEDLACGFGRVWLPEALQRKFPSAGRDWRWQSVFPASRRWNVRPFVPVIVRALPETTQAECMTARFVHQTHESSIRRELELKD